MSQIKEYVKIAIMNIKHNRGRSVLTMLGIIIGISSVIMVLSIGNGVRSQINDELDGIAGGMIEVYIDTSRKDNNVRLSMDDVDLILDNVDHVKGVTPVIGSWGSVEGPKASMDIKMLGGTAGLEYNTKDPVVKGRYFNDNDVDGSMPVCVITESNAKALFGTTDVIGMTIDATLWGYSQELKIVGLRKDNPSSIISMLNGSGYVTAEVPITTMADRYGYWIDEIDDLLVFAEKPEYATQVSMDVTKLLESRHHCQGENQITIQNLQDYTATYDTILGGITLFVSLVAAISLIVGGIGVMNIMLVSVTERTREIGIRKALGARTKSIMWQFLAEAGIITLIGGIIGIILGVLSAFGICSLINMQAQVSVITVILASMFSCGVGIFFGIYPAKKAAALSPIEALRHE